MSKQKQKKEIVPVNRQDAVFCGEINADGFPAGSGNQMILYSSKFGSTFEENVHTDGWIDVTLAVFVNICAKTYNKRLCYCLPAWNYCIESSYGNGRGIYMKVKGFIYLWQYSKSELNAFSSSN